MSLKTSNNVLNSIITLGNTDASGRGRHFKSRFIQPGVAGYPGQFGNALLRQETLSKFVRTLIACPVIINHKDITKKNADRERVGVVSNVWYNEFDGWYYCEGVIWDEDAINLIENEGWSVSCSYEVLLADDTGGYENNVPYDIEFLDAIFTHLAIVKDPRYERATIVLNAKMANFNPEQKRDKNGKWVKDEAAIKKKKDNIVPIEVEKKDIPQFKSKEELGNWFKEIFKNLGNVTIKDTGIRIDLYSGNADRETFKRRFQQEPNKAVAKAFEEIVTKAIKVDERQKDERHIHDQEIYYNKLKLGGENYDVNLFVDYLEPNKEYRYAGHSTTKINNNISARDTQVINHIMLTKADTYIIPQIENNLTPNIEEHGVNNSKQTFKETFLDAIAEVITNCLGQSVNNERWITVGSDRNRAGRHILVKDGQTKEDAVKEYWEEIKDKNEQEDILHKNKFENDEDLQIYTKRMADITKHFENVTDKEYIEYLKDNDINSFKDHTKKAHSSTIPGFIKHFGEWRIQKLTDKIKKLKEQAEKQKEE